MRSILFIFIILILASCSNNRREALETICKGVKNTGKSCSSAVAIAGKCAKCASLSENDQNEEESKLEISTNELLENSMLW